MEESFLFKLSLMGIPIALLGCLLQTNGVYRYYSNKKSLILICVGSALIGVQVGFLIVIAYAFFQGL